MLALLGRKATTNLDSISKIRDITLRTKVQIVKAMVFFFLVVMYGCESWTIKKSERWRTDAFNRCLQCWIRLLRVCWTARRSDQSILKEINPEYSLEGLMMKLKFPILWPPDAKSWIRKAPDAGKDWGEGDDRRQDGWMASSTQWTWVWADSGRGWRTGEPGVL